MAGVLVVKCAIHSAAARGGLTGNNRRRGGSGESGFVCTVWCLLTTFLMIAGRIGNSMVGRKRSGGCDGR